MSEKALNSPLQEKGYLYLADYFEFQPPIILNINRGRQYEDIWCSSNWIFL